jgi:hypothetical protein
MLRLDRKSKNTLDGNPLVKMSANWRGRLATWRTVRQLRAPCFTPLSSCPCAHQHMHDASSSAETRAPESESEGEGEGNAFRRSVPPWRCECDLIWHGVSRKQSGEALFGSDDLGRNPFILSWACPPIRFQSSLTMTSSRRCREASKG